MRRLVPWLLAAGCTAADARDGQPDASLGGGSADAAVTGGSIEVLAADQPGPIGIAVDETYVYWNNIGEAGWGAGEGSVVKLAKAGGTPEVLADHEEAVDLALDTESVYWARGRSNAVAHGSAVVKVAKSGGTRVVVAQDLAEAQSLAVDDTHIYFQNWLAAAGSLDRMTKAGAELTELDPGSQNGPMDIVASGSLIYFANGNAGEVKAYDKTSGQVSRVTFGFTGAGTLAVGDAGRLYFSACNDIDCNMAIFTVEGRETDFRTVAEVGGQIRGLAWDGARLYATAWQRIVAIDPGTGDVMTVVELQGAASALAVDAEFIYWADFNGRTINRVPK